MCFLSAPEHCETSVHTVWCFCLEATDVSKDVFDIIKKENKTIIIVTHDINEALNYCNKIIVLSKRPARIKNIYNINGEKDYYNLIWNDIDKWHIKII